MDSLITSFDNKLAKQYIKFIRDKILLEYKGYVIPAGSYRRGDTKLSDIDLLLVEPLNINNFIEAMEKHNFIKKIITHGPQRSTIIVQLKGTRSSIQIDLMNTTMEQLPFALLHFTGSKQFNIIMRKHAKEKGLTLNEYGLTDSSGSKYKAITEKDIFKLVGMKYHEPNQRSK